MDIKPIETKYKGYRFRSRLEARWAVFLDSLGVRWEYEKEGYQLSDGTFYLPDFWLPDDKLWLEIKSDSASESELKKFYKFTNSGMPAILAKGLPNDDLLELHCWDTAESSTGWGSWEADIFTVKDNRIVFFIIGYSSFFFERSLFRDGYFEDEIEVVFGSQRQALPRVFDAADAARSARFEHGEVNRC